MEINERPILFSTAMIKAILAGNKTMTRRVIKNMDLIQDVEDGIPYFEDEYGDYHKTATRCPYGFPGGLLYVRETTCIAPKNWAAPDDSCIPDYDGDLRSVSFKADGHSESAMRDYGLKWTPSIHVPKWATRIWLEVKDIRAERLQDITPGDAIKEGIDLDSDFANLCQNILDNCGSYSHDVEGNSSEIATFKKLWDSINGKPRKNGKDISWNSNPWVFAVSFDVLK
jgi:hypothetical protein